MTRKKQKASRQSKQAVRSLRIRQAIFIGIGLIVILSMVLAMIAK